MEIQTNGTAIPVASNLQNASGTIDARQELKSTVAPIKDNQRLGIDDKKDKVEASLNDIEKATNQVKKFVSSMNSDLQFTVDKDTGITVVKVIDKTTNEIIRQIPGDEILQIAKTLDRLQGLLVKQQA